MSDLIEFLLARIAEDEAAAVKATPGPWHHNPRKEWHSDPDKMRAARAGIQMSGGEEFVGAGDDLAIGVAATGPSDDAQSMADAHHIARHDPARVLRECEAKRALIADTDGLSGQFYDDIEYRVLTNLASIYVDHPDFRDEWR